MLEGIIVEYSRDQADRALRLGGALEESGYRVVYKMAEGPGTLVFKANGRTYTWEELDLLALHSKIRRLRIWLTDLVLAYLVKHGEASVGEVAEYATAYYGPIDGLTRRVRQELELLVLGGIAEKTNGAYKLRPSRVPRDTLERLEELGLTRGRGR